MTVSAASALNVTGTDTDARDYTTASWTPTAGKTYLVALGVLDLGSARTTPTLSGNGITWNIVNSTGPNAAQPGLYVWRGYAGAGATSGALTFTGCVSSGQTADGAIWGIAELSGSNQSATFLAQNEPATTTTDSVTANLSAFASASNATGAWILSYDDASTTGPAITAGSGFAITTGLNASQAAGGDGMRLAFEFRNDNDTSVDATAVAANDRLSIIAVEIKNLVTTTGTATVAGDGSVSGSGLAVRSRTGSVAGSGAVAGTGIAVRSQTGTVAGTGAVAATGARVVAGSATVDGAGAVTGTGLRVCSSTAALDGAGAVAGTGERVATGAADLAGSATIGAAGHAVTAGDATLDGAGLLSATGVSTPAGSGAWNGSGALDGDSVLSGDGSVETRRARFGGGPISVRDTEQQVWEQQMQRLLREDEELLCLV